MKITVLKNSFLEALVIVQKAIAIKNIQEELTGILLKAENGLLYLFATDLDLSIETSLPTEITTEGSVVLPGNKFIEIIRKLPDTQIHIEKEEHSESVIISYGINKKIELNGWSADNFPILPLINTEYQIKIKSDVFKNMIKETIFATAVDEKRTIYSGLYFELEKNSLSLVASDTFRLVVKKEIITGDNQHNINIIIPRKALLEISRIAEEENIEIYGNGSKIFFRSGQTVVLSNLIKGNFPDYKKVIPKEFKTVLKIDKGLLHDVLERASVFGTEKEKNYSFKIYIQEKTIRIESKSGLGSIDEEIEAEITGEKQEIRFKTNFYLEALKVIPEETVILKYIGPLEAAIMEYDDGEKFQYLILPLRT